MSLMPRIGTGGYYDDTGNWVQTKHCFMSCGANCDCQPPGRLYYSAVHDKRLKKDSQSDAGADRV